MCDDDNLYLHSLKVSSNFLSQNNSSLSTKLSQFKVLFSTITIFKSFINWWTIFSDISLDTQYLYLFIAFSISFWVKALIFLHSFANNDAESSGN